MKTFLREDTKKIKSQCLTNIPHVKYGGVSQASKRRVKRLGESLVMTYVPTSLFLKKS